MRNETTAAKTAKAIRADLKKAFPGQKFSVTSDTYTGGSSVRISWVDGPLLAQVQAMVGKYEMGHFDGMNDIYEHSNMRLDIPQVKFVFPTREMSEESRAFFMEYAQTFFQPSPNDGLYWTPTEIARRAFHDPKSTAQEWAA